MRATATTGAAEALGEGECREQSEGGRREPQGDADAPHRVNRTEIPLEPLEAEELKSHGDVAVVENFPSGARRAAGRCEGRIRPAGFQHQIRFPQAGSYVF